MNTKLIVLGALLSVITTVFQCIPALLSEIFIFLTIFATIPIYLAGKIKPSLGILCYVISFLLISFVSPHENIMFIFTNGILGLSLGITSYYSKSTCYISLISGIFLLLSLNLVPYIAGVLLFGLPLHLNLMTQIPLFLFCWGYSYVFLYLCQIIYARLLPKLPIT